jgi:hypothetical protein
VWNSRVNKSGPSLLNLSKESESGYRTQTFCSFPRTYSENSNLCIKIDVCSKDPAPNHAEDSEEQKPTV